jgi:nucleotidyltransferase substrate binding protein (TIGR01987 family)
MERLKRALEQCERAAGTLISILREKETEIVRDATIQRFEYTFEAVWKTLKLYLKEQEGIVAGSPKECFRQALAVGLVNKEECETGLAMVNDHNLTSHTYMEAVAKLIYSRVGGYSKLIQALLKRMKTRSFSDSSSGT